MANRPAVLGVRASVSVMTALVVAIAYAIAAILMLLAIREVLRSNERDALTARSDEIVQALAYDDPLHLPDSLTAASGAVDLIQVIHAPDRILANTHPGKVLASLPAPGEEFFLETSNIQQDTEYLLFARSVKIEGADFVIVVGLDHTRAAVMLAALTAMLAVTWPIVVAAAAAATNMLVGRALRPVEEMRRQVQVITTAGIGERVPVPPSDDEIARLAVTMNAMLDRLQAGREAQLAFVGDASHELRSPISTFSGILELALRDDAGVDAATVRDVLHPEVERMKELVEGLLLLARTDEHGLALATDEVDLDDLVGAEGSRLRTLHDHLEVRVRLTPARVLGDTAALTRVLRNLGDNAAGFAGSRMELALTTTDGSARVTVDDDGPGIPPEDRERVFERFVRLSADRNRARGGAGLGLAIVAELVKAHGGSIRAEDSPLGGARFVLTLPLE